MVCKAFSLQSLDFACSDLDLSPIVAGYSLFHQIRCDQLWIHITLTDCQPLSSDVCILFSIICCQLHSLAWFSLWGRATLEYNSCHSLSPWVFYFSTAKLCSVCVFSPKAASEVLYRALTVKICPQWYCVRVIVLQLCLTSWGLLLSRQTYNMRINITDILTIFFLSLFTVHFQPLCIFTRLHSHFGKAIFCDPKRLD